MGRISKSFALILILIMTVSSLSVMMVKPAYALSIPKPSVPEFTIKYADYSYDIPPTYGIDQYTGKTIITKSGEHIDNRTIEITVKNQPFTPFTDTNGNNINMFYNVRFKGSFGQDWTEMFGVERAVWYNFNDPIDNYGYMIQTYSSQFTIIELTDPPAQGQMDIQVTALEGYTNRTTVVGHIFMADVMYTFYGEESGWSNTQTIIIPASSSTSTPSILTPNSTASTTPTIPEFSTLIILPLFAVATLLSIVLVRKILKITPLFTLNN